MSCAGDPPVRTPWFGPLVLGPFAFGEDASGDRIVGAARITGRRLRDSVELAQVPLTMLLSHRDPPRTASSRSFEDGLDLCLRHVLAFGLEQRLALGLGRTDAPWIFCHPDSSLPWRPDYVSKQRRRLRTDLDLEDARLHDLRHLSVTQLLAAGVDPKTVPGRHGHARVAMTLDRYSHFVPARDRDAAEVLDELLG